MTEINEIDDIVWRLESILRENPSVIKTLKPKMKKLSNVATNTARIHKLCSLWHHVPQSMLNEFNTDESSPFIKLCVRLAEERVNCSEISLCLWWRRMLATGQQNIITYFSWSALSRLEVDLVTGSDVLRACTDNVSILENTRMALGDDASVDFRIREMLGGISMNADVTEAWKKWALRHHPDKGGDPERFLRVKVVYDEWMTLNGKTKQHKQ